MNISAFDKLFFVSAYYTDKKGLPFLIKWVLSSVQPNYDQLPKLVTEHTSQIFNLNQFSSLTPTCKQTHKSKIFNHFSTRIAKKESNVHKSITPPNLNFEHLTKFAVC